MLPMTHCPASLAGEEPSLEPFRAGRCLMNMRLRSAFALSALVATLGFCSPGVPAASAQGAQSTIALHPDLLPTTGFADWKATGNAPAAAEPAFSLVNANKAALEESSPQRSAVENFTGPGGKTLHIEAVELKDASGALAVYSVLSQPGMHELKDLGTVAEVGDGGVVFVTGASAAVAFPATAADLPVLRSLAAVMPKAVGSQGLQPLLPALLPVRGLVAGSARYAMGPQSYMAGGGVLPAAGLGWDKEAEAVTAKYSDHRGAETLTLLLYPTPTIAGPHLRATEGLLQGLGPSFRNAKTRREGQLVIVANGTFSPEAAQALVENTHIHQFASTDKAMPTPEIVETRKTFGLFANIILFSGLLGAGAIGVGLFLGGGRALLRILQGKPPASETEFLSLHLDHQNPSPVFSKE